jgi:hypothetical protein
MHMVAHGLRDTNACRWTLGLQPCRDIYDFTMEVSTVSNRVANVNPDSKSDGSIRRLVAIVNWNLPLHLHGAAHRTVYAVKDDEQRVAAGLDYFAAVLVDCRTYQVSSERPQPFKRPCVIKPIRRL